MGVRRASRSVAQRACPESTEGPSSTRGRPDLSSLASLGNQPRDRLWVTTTFLGHTSARRAASHAMHIRLYPPAKLAFVLLTVAGASIAAADVERPVSARRVVPTTPLGGSRSPLSPRCGPDSDDVPLTNATGAISDGSGPGLYLPHTDCTWIVRPSTLAPPPDPDGASPTLPPSPPDDGGITLVFERFDTVFDDDFLYVTDPDASDAVPARPRELALYTGALPVPFAVRFDAVAALTLRFVAGDNRDEGLRSSTSPTARATTTAPREVDASAASARVTTDGSDRTAPYRFRPSSATARRPEASSASERRDIFASSRRRSRRISCSSSR